MTLTGWFDSGSSLPWLAALILAQISGVILIAWAIAGWPNRKAAATRHAIWLSALLGTLIGPAVLIAVDWAGWSLRVTRPPATTVERPLIVERPVDRLNDSPRSGRTVIPTGERERGAMAREALPASERVPGRSTTDSTAPKGWLPGWSAMIRVALCAWAVGSACLLGWLGYGMAALSRLRRAARQVHDERIGSMLDEIAREVGLKTPPRVLASRWLSGPVAAGIVRPVVLLPEHLTRAMEGNRLRDILVHESAHLARRDPLVGLLQRVAAALFWPNPLVHLMNRELTRAREETCDNYVLRFGNRVRYARTLLDLAESLRAAPTALVAAGLLPARWDLAARVTGLLDEGRDLMVHVNRGKFGGLAALMLLVGLPFSAFGPVRFEARAGGESPDPVVATIQEPSPATPAIDDGPITEEEIAGKVVDAEGRPIEGAKVMAWSWVPGFTTFTDAEGRFRFRPFGQLYADPDEGAELRVVKEGYGSREFEVVKGGTDDLVVTMSDTTAFEGKVTDAEGRPAPDVLIRMNHPHMRGGREVGRRWSETRTDAEGRYRLHVPPATFDIQVRAPGLGVARRSDVVIKEGEIQSLDLPLERGVAFRARIVDSETGEPVEGIRVWHWQHPGIEGRSDAEGIAAIDDMMPGVFQFDVESPGMERLDMGEIRLVGEGPWHSRWWSDQAVSEWNRREVGGDPARGGWQYNLDSLDFELKPGMDPVEIVVERGVVVRGRVIDPEGQPVVGATVAPALTGTGNSLTGDTRFSVTTGPVGRFATLLPASNNREYNLVAHDGGLMEWRDWANGVTETFRTVPGEQLDNIIILLTRPATVRGRVVDQNGKPVVDRQVRASAADKLENRYYDPTTSTTDADGRFELTFIRPAEQHIQVDPFWLDATQAPAGTSQTVTLEEGEVREGIELIAQP